MLITFSAILNGISILILCGSIWMTNVRMDYISKRIDYISKRIDLLENFVYKKGFKK